MDKQPVDLALIGAYLHNLQLALVNDQPQHAELLLAHTMELMAPVLAGQYAALHSTDLPILLTAGVGLDPGKKRQGKPNEDFVFVAQGLTAWQEPFGLFVVADGMGGHASGQEASRLAIQAMVDFLLPKLSGGRSMREEALKNLLTEGAQRANQAVYQRNMEARADMGTTMTAALIAGANAYVANVGDSRTYLYREPEGLIQVTRDHSVVADLLAAGSILPDEVYTHPERNKIYRSLGEKVDVEVDTFQVSLQDGDTLLLCSDGLWEMVREWQIAAILAASGNGADHKTEKLVQLALAAGGLDNIGLAVIQVRIDVTGLPTIISHDQRVAMLI